MRILLLNKFTAPDPAPTARLLGELGEGLRARGWEVISRSAGGGYRQGTGSGGWRRWAKEARAHWRLLLEGLTAPRPDVILCLSDPPGLVFTAALLSKIRRVPLAHWVMDVYPQIAAALGEVTTTNPAYRLLHHAVRVGYSRCQVIGCLDMDMAKALALAEDKKLLLTPPWPPTTLMQGLDDEIVPRAAVGGAAQPFTWLYSGNLGRAHDFETLLEAQRILEVEGHPASLIFQGRGPQLEQAKKQAALLGLKDCQWLDYVQDELLLVSLLTADVVVATQKPETRGLLWPSKLAVLKHLGRPLLWIGPVDGDIARMLRHECPQAAIFVPGDASGVAAWLKQRITDSCLAPSSKNSFSRMRERLAHDQSLAVDAWHQRLSSLVCEHRLPS